MPLQDVLHERNKIPDKKMSRRRLGEATDLLHSHREILEELFQAPLFPNGPKGIDFIIEQSQDPKAQKLALSVIALEWLAHIGIDPGEEGTSREKIKGEMNRAIDALRLRLDGATFVEKVPEKKKACREDLPPCD